MGKILSVTLIRSSGIVAYHYGGKKGKETSRERLFWEAQKRKRIWGEEKGQPDQLLILYKEGHDLEKKKEG